MSYYWRPACLTCQVSGPDIRSGHSGLKFGPDADPVPTLLKVFLDDHQWHEIVMLGETQPNPWEAK